MAPARSRALPGAFHLATLGASSAFWAYLDRRLWFFGDDWQFLVGRGMFYAPSNPRSIFYPHFGHWSTLPVLLWRGLFNIFHLSSYWPYLVPLLLANLIVMDLVWRLCRRNGADPWVAACAVAVLGFLGAGAEDLGWAFQVGFVGSLAFGLVAVLLVDVAQPSRASTTLCSFAALASLMCSTVGDAMVVALAVVLLARRPAKRAASVLALPVGAYALWWATVGRLGTGSLGGPVHANVLTAMPSYVWTGLAAALGRSFDLGPEAGTLLVAFSAWAAWQSRRLLAEHPAVAGLGVGAVAFYLIVALGRDSAGSAASTAPRYIYVAAALLLPAVACALSPPASTAPASDVAHRGNVARAAVAVALLASAVGGAGQARSWAEGREALVSTLRTEITATSQLLASGAHDAFGPGAAPIGYSPDLTVSVLARLGRSGLLGRQRLAPVTITNARALLALGLTPAPKFSGRSHLVSAHGVATWAGPAGCETFAPLFAGATGTTVLASSDPGLPTSVEVKLRPPPSGAPASIGALLSPPGAPTGDQPAQLYLPASGTAYLDDNFPRAGLVLEWSTGTPLSLCGLAQLGAKAGWLDGPPPPSSNGVRVSFGSEHDDR